MNINFPFSSSTQSLKMGSPKFSGWDQKTHNLLTQANNTAYKEMTRIQAERNKFLKGDPKRPTTPDLKEKEAAYKQANKAWSDSFSQQPQ